MGVSPAGPANAVRPRATCRAEDPRTGPGSTPLPTVTLRRGCADLLAPPTARPYASARATGAVGGTGTPSLTAARCKGKSSGVDASLATVTASALAAEAGLPGWPPRPSSSAYSGPTAAAPQSSCSTGGTPRAAANTGRYAATSAASSRDGTAGSLGGYPPHGTPASGPSTTPCAAVWCWGYAPGAW